MDKFQAITAFARVVEAGSFAGAATRLGVSVSSVSRLVADLETHLGSRLLNRTTRRISLTEAGRVFHERSVQLLADLEEAEASASEGAAVPRGTLRLSGPVTFGTEHIAPAVAEFMRRYPTVKLELELSDRIVDLVDEGFDAAVRIGAVRGQNLVARRVGTSRLLCCASPAYLATHGEPRTPEDLAKHACLLYQYAPQRDTWPFTGKDGEERRVRVSGPAYANNGEFLADGPGDDNEGDVQSEFLHRLQGLLLVYFDEFCVRFDEALVENAARQRTIIVIFYRLQVMSGDPGLFRDFAYRYTSFFAGLPQFLT